VGRVASRLLVLEPFDRLVQPVERVVGQAFAVVFVGLENRLDLEQRLVEELRIAASLVGLFERRQDASGLSRTLPRAYSNASRVVMLSLSVIVIVGSPFHTSNESCSASASLRATGDGGRPLCFSPRGYDLPQLPQNFRSTRFGRHGSRLLRPAGAASGRSASLLSRRRCLGEGRQPRTLPHGRIHVSHCSGILIGDRLDCFVPCRDWVLGWTLLTASASRRASRPNRLPLGGRRTGLMRPSRFRRLRRRS
jgi:hypothetical protein